MGIPTPDIRIENLVLCRQVRVVEPGSLTIEGFSPLGVVVTGPGIEVAVCAVVTGLEGLGTFDYTISILAPWGERIEREGSVERRGFTDRHVLTTPPQPFAVPVGGPYRFDLEVRAGASTAARSATLEAFVERHAVAN